MASQPCAPGCSCGKHDSTRYAGPRGPWTQDKRQPCGTAAGYAHHRAWAEVPCQACCDAEAAKSRAYRSRVVTRAERIAGAAVSYRQALRILRSVRRSEHGAAGLELEAG